MQSFSTEEVVRAIYGPNRDHSIVWFFLHYDKATGKNSAPRNAIWRKVKTEIARRNKLRYDVHFKPNDGNIRCFIMDFDCHDHSPDDIEIAKIQVVSKIKEFDYKPTVVNESRHGIHVYWKIKGDITEQQYVQVMEYLNASFMPETIDLYQVDDAFIKRSNISIRIPGTIYWNVDGATDFTCKILELDGGCEYCWDEFPIEKRKLPFLSSFSYSEIDGVLHPSENEGCLDRVLRLWSPLKKSDGVLRFGRLMFPDVHDVSGYLKSRDLAEYLNDHGYNVHHGKFHCPFHDDRRPSASIFTSKSGFQYFICRAKSCQYSDKMMTIIDFAQIKDKDNAWWKLCDTYKVGIETEWQRKEHDIMEHSIEAMKDLSDYPYLDKIVTKWGLRDKIVLFMQFSGELNADEDSTVNSRWAFWYVVENFDKKLKDHNISSNRRSAAEIVAIAAFLGLLTRHRLEVLPEDIQKILLDSQREQANEYHAQYYTIPVLDNNVLTEADHRAHIIFDSGIKRNGWCWEILRHIFPVGHKHGFMKHTHNVLGEHVATA